MSNKLNFFTPTYEDEDIRSIVYRYHTMAANPSYIKTNFDLFNINSSTYQSAFPPNIDYLLKQIPGNNNYCLKDFISKHTFYPMIKLFSTKLENEKLLTYLSHGHRNYSIAKLNTSFFIADYIMYCPNCLHEDYETLGEIYIHRIHQIKGICICANHKTPLISRCTNCNQLLAKDFKNQLSQVSCTSCGYDLTRTTNNSSIPELLITLANDLKKIFILDAYIDIDYLKERYLFFATGRGLYSPRSGLFQNNKLIKELNNNFNTDIIINLGIPPCKYNKHFTVNYLDIKYKGNPLIHLIIMKYLASSFENFMFGELPVIASLIPFGNGPWKCINEYCEFYNELNIKKCVRVYCPKTKQYIGKFVCMDCGQEHTLRFDGIKIIENSLCVHKLGQTWKRTYLNKPRTEQTKGKLNYYTKGLITAGDENKPNGRESKYPHEWFEKLIETFSKNNNINQTSKALYIRHSTVKRYVGIYLEHKTLEIFKTLPVHEDYKEFKCNNIKKRVSSLLEENECDSRSKIMEKIGYNDYYYLISHDPEWAESQLPKNKKLNIGIANKDNQLFLRLKDVVNQLNTNKPNRRITKNTLLKKLRCTYIDSKMFPISHRYLQDNVEDTETYQLRKIIPITKRLKKGGVKSLKKAILNLPLFKNCSPVVLTEIENVVNDEINFKSFH